MQNSELSEKDVGQITALGITPEQIADQIEKFKKGSAPVNLIRAATIGDGIHRFSDIEQEQLVEFYDEGLTRYSIVKFVPASGAASRMFKTLCTFYHHQMDISEMEIEKQVDLDNENYEYLQLFIDSLKNKRFAFHEELASALEKNGKRLESLLEQCDYQTILEYVLTPAGLNYENLPKGLITFHKYDESVRTSFEEHMVEGVAYANDYDGEINLHFTISPRFESAICEVIDNARPRFESGEITFKIDFSEQKHSTDTCAVDMENNLFRDRKGKLVFRPGGHGALIENLNEIDGDIVFIKNVDNVIHERLIESTVKYKKILAGYLMQKQEQLFQCLARLVNAPGTQGTAEMAKFAQNELNIPLPVEFDDWELTRQHVWLFRKLNRPLRVCGMVKNEGEPGGGPFWVEKNGDVSLQIVEGAQIDKSIPQQVDILKASTHFNPVDLVCSAGDYQGDRFNLKNFVAHDTYFISEKSMEGKPLKALELPGLWNGAMYDWITLFVEVPIATFNPVKTVNDLLRDTHQP